MKNWDFQYTSVTDGDPWGFHIAMVIISGSAKLAHVNHELATPDAKFLGVTASDIINYDLPTDPLKDIDVLRLKELYKDPDTRDDFWKVEIKKMLKIGKKAEQAIRYLVKKCDK